LNDINRDIEVYKFKQTTSMFPYVKMIPEKTNVKGYLIISLDDPTPHPTSLILLVPARCDLI
jgi:hypothetical protein